MARKQYRYSLARRDAKLVGVCSTIGEIVGLDPTFIRVGFVAAAVLVSWQLALFGYIGLGIYFTVQRKRAVESANGKSDFDRMGEPVTIRPSVHALRSNLDATDRRLMAIDGHLNSNNDELAREIEALREEK